MRILLFFVFQMVCLHSSHSGEDSSRVSPTSIAELELGRVEVKIRQKDMIAIAIKKNLSSGRLRAVAIQREYFGFRTREENGLISSVSAFKKFQDKQNKQQKIKAIKKNILFGRLRAAEIQTEDCIFRTREEYGLRPAVSAFERFKDRNKHKEG